MLVGISDKILHKWLEGKEYMNCSNEGEAVAICAGYFYATGKIGTAFMSADGFMNALNFITSWIIPSLIPINIVISIGRTEDPHVVATKITEPIINLLNEIHYGSKAITFEFVRK